MDKSKLMRCKECVFAFGDRDCEVKASRHIYTDILYGLRPRSPHNDAGLCPDYKEKVE